MKIKKPFLIAEIGINHNGDINIAKQLIEVNGVESIFTGPGFLTLTKEETSDWNIINNDILNKFDTI